MVIQLAYKMEASSGTNNSNANLNSPLNGGTTGGDATSIAFRDTVAPVGGAPFYVANGNGIQVDQQLLKHDPGISGDWSNEEQSILEEELAKFANELNVIKYIKIAALLPEKTVRDVALRCRWMLEKENGRRPKVEDQFPTKKSKEKKEKSWNLQHIDNGDGVSYEYPAAIEGTMRLLFEENSRVINQIRDNLAAYKLQENTDLLVCFRGNILAMLNRMKDTPGIMSQMPPLPVELNSELADTILPNTSQIPASLPM